MNSSSKKIQNIYLSLTFSNTLAASFIWGINTLFLLDAGLSNGQAFLVNAFFTLGMVLFEIPTGVVADARGRRLSYLIGTITLIATTLLYVLAWQTQANLSLWIVASLLLGFGFTFFSGATEAWLVDSLKYSGYKGEMEAVFAKGQIAFGIAMLSGSVAGGVIAQMSNLGVPYLIRTGILVLNFLIAWLFMKDLGFEPVKEGGIATDMKRILKGSIKYGLQNPPVKWLIIAGPFSAGVGIYAFYAMQPYLLELYGNPNAYGIAGVAAAIVAGAQIGGGLLVSKLKKIFKKRTSVLGAAVLINVMLLALIGLVSNFYIALILLVGWALIFAAKMPIRQSYLNELVNSKQRATVLSFDSLVSSTGGIFTQPVLGRSADLYSYSFSFIGAALFQIIALPFLLLSKKQKSKADTF